MPSALERLAWNKRGPFTYEVRQQASPAVATDWSIVVPGSEVWQLVAINATLTTDANVANRVPQLVIDDQTSRSVRYPVGAVQAAGAGIEYTWLAGYPVAPAAVQANSLINPLAFHLLQSGWRIRSLTSLIQAGDQWSGITVTIERMARPPETLSQRLDIPSDMLTEVLQQLVEASQ